MESGSKSTETIDTLSSPPMLESFRIREAAENVLHMVAVRLVLCYLECDR